MILRNSSYLILLVLIPILVLLWHGRGRRLSAAALTLRLLSVALIIVALADPMVPQPGITAGPLVLLVDQSDSLGEAGKVALRERADALAAAHNGPVSTIYFGADSTAEQEQPPQASDTDIEGALRVASDLLNAGGRVILLSDGVQTRGDARAEARALAAAGIRVDTLAYKTPAQPEIWITGLELPRTLRQGEEYTISPVIHSSSATSGLLEIFAGAQQLRSEQVSLSAGENPLPPIRARAEQPGILQLQARITARPDTFRKNNSTAATTLVAPPPRVLLVEDQPGAASTLSAAVRPAGIIAETIHAARLPTQLSRLADYEGIVLIDVSATQLTLDQMATLREFVRSEGRGLVTTGGRSSFTLGSYKDTPLEEVLPVMMTPPPRPERPAVTMLLILDHSASMYGSPGSSKLDMAKESAILATETLQEEDHLGVLVFDTQADWVVEFQMLGTGLSLGEIQDRIASIPIGGGTNIYRALNRGLEELARQPGQVRHAILLTDGKSTTLDREPYRRLVEEARNRNISLSAIAIGEDSDTALLQDLAQWGAGRYYFAAEPQDIPRLTLMESEIASAEAQIEGDFRAELNMPHPILRDLVPDEFPRLQGYVATTIKPGAELVLSSPEADPLLAVWQYGLGRAVAWTPGVEAPWAELWPEWIDYGKLWAQVIRYTLPEPGSGLLQARVVPDGDAVTISVDSMSPSGEPFDLADTEATIILPDGSWQNVPLRQTKPGYYVERVSLPINGPYAINVRQQKGDQERSTSTGYVQHYSAEYMPAAGSEGATLLADISAATGGQALTTRTDSQPAAAGQPGSAREFWPWLLLAAALLWPLEIAIRRGWFRSTAPSP